MLAAELNRMGRQLDAAFRGVREADELRRRLIDVASHELRTPIAFILGMADLCRRRGDASPVLAKIAAKAARLNRIVENMFKLQIGELFEARLDVAPVDLARLVMGAVTDVQPFLQERKQQIDLDLPESIPPFEADAEKLRDVLDNLLSNAVRFSPDGATIGLRVRCTDDGIEFVVTDRGPGIQPDRRDSLFEPFFGRSDDALRHSSGEFQYESRGMGLGLSVVKRFVDMHSGTVQIENVATQEGGGSRFVVTIPLRQPAAPRQSPPANDRND